MVGPSNDVFSLMSSIGRRIASIFARNQDSTATRGTYELVDRAADRDMQSLSAADKTILRKVSDKIPWSAFLIAIVEVCERFTYYGLSGVLQNYIQRSTNDPSGLPGALGLGQTSATGLVSLLQFWAYVTPIPGAIVADQYLGRFWTIFYSACIYVLGVSILFLTALPASIASGAALPGLVVSIIVIGIGTGGIKSNVSPLIAEQYANVTPFVKTLQSGERVIIDPAVTIQRIYMVFYACINIGSLSPVATVYLEKYVGFWSAFLLCAAIFVVGATILLISREQFVSQPPKGSVIPNAFKVCFIALKHRNLDAAKPGARRTPVPWDDQFVEEVRRALLACSVFSFFSIYWLAYNQQLSNLISQAGQMELHGIPNDLMQNIDPITILVFIPMVDQILYPALRKMGIPFKPITRIFFGFIFAAAAMAYAAGVQSVIYAAAPCYNAPLACEAAKKPDGHIVPNQVHVAVQTPAYVLIGLSEIFASITGLEYAFTKAPASMKSFIMSLFLSQSAIGAAFGAALAPVAVDPNLTWLYAGLAIAVLVAGVVFWSVFRKYNDIEESMNELEQHGDRANTEKSTDQP